MKIINKILININILCRIYFNKTFKENNIVAIEGIVFSMDRPIQLFALLESYYKYCKNSPLLYIIYKTSDIKYEDGYKEVENYFKNQKVIFINEKLFKVDLIDTLKQVKSRYLFFLVDDNIFKSSFSFNDYFTLPNRDKYILSLRLGENLNYCYTKAIDQSLPKFNRAGKFLSWIWRKGIADWNYIFSVDGHVYKTKDVLEMSKLISFKAPNSYEANMNIFRFVFRLKKGMCYPNSVLINVCLNRVQDEIENISGEISPIQLLEYWNEKKKIDISYFYKIDNKSAHIEIRRLPLVNRK